jgi:hypothetical protein
MNPNEMARQIVTAGNALIKILDEESAALAEVRIDRIEALRERKESAASLYETTVRRLNENAPLFAQATPATRRELSVFKGALDNATARNVNALRAALELNRRLVQTIAASVNRQRIAAAGYTKSGAAYARPKSSNTGEVVPVSLNETL